MLYLTDISDIKKDTKRCEQFVQCILTLNQLISDKPPSDDVIVMFGKVCLHVSNKYGILSSQVRPKKNAVFPVTRPTLFKPAISKKNLDPPKKYYEKKERKNPDRPTLFQIIMLPETQHFFRPYF